MARVAGVEMQCVLQYLTAFGQKTRAFGNDVGRRVPPSDPRSRPRTVDAFRQIVDEDDIMAQMRPAHHWARAAECAPQEFGLCQQLIEQFGNGAMARVSVRAIAVHR